MYIPAPFREDDPAKLHPIMEQYSFATVITHGGGAPFASHLPVLFDPSLGPHGTLRGHLARANPQSKHLASGEESLVIFQGPHAYISPSWYQTELAVPTWNYVAVHAYGIARMIDDDDHLAALLQRMIEKYESGSTPSWSGDRPADYRGKLLKAIIGFEIPISRIEGKFKLGQNRSEADLHSVYHALVSSEREGDLQLAAVLEREGLIE